MLDTDSELDDPLETETENSSTQCYEIAEKSWVDYGIKEFILLLTKKMDTSGQNMKLEAKIMIIMEYPLRPPLFTVNLYPPGEFFSENDYLGWHNEVRVMEAEVNLHMLKMVSPDDESYTLSHQVYCLAMLFDYYMDEATPSSNKRKSNSVIDVGLCRPVSGRLLARSFRGRDRRKMIFWKDMECTTGYPF